MPALRPGTATRPSRAGRRGLAAGLLLLLAGVAVAGYLGWQLVGTTWVAHRRYDAQVAAVRAAWDEGEASVDAGHGRVLGVVRIPGLDRDVPLLEGTSDRSLASGLGHFAGTADPGERGNLVIGGHRITHGEPLRDLPRLEAGDRVVVDTQDATYTYVLDSAGDALSVSDGADWVLAARPDNPDPDGVQPRAGARRLLTLVTCAELFHTSDRLVVFGHLVETRAASDRTGEGDGVATGAVTDQ